MLDNNIRLTSEPHQPLQPGSSESYSGWLQAWLSHISDTLTAVLVPPKAANITTPLNHGNQLSAWLTRKKATKMEIISLVGLLQHTCKVVRPRRSFVSRMYITAAKLEHLSDYTRLNKDFRSDLHWWNTFVSIWNGTSFPSS